MFRCLIYRDRKYFWNFGTSFIYSNYSDTIFTRFKKLNGKIRVAWIRQTAGSGGVFIAGKICESAVSHSVLITVFVITLAARSVCGNFQITVSDTCCLILRVDDTSRRLNRSWNRIIGILFVLNAQRQCYIGSLVHFCVFDSNLDPVIARWSIGSYLKRKIFVIAIIYSPDQCIFKQYIISVQIFSASAACLCSYNYLSVFTDNNFIFAYCWIIDKLAVIFLTDIQPESFLDRINRIIVFVLYNYIHEVCSGFFGLERLAWYICVIIRIVNEFFINISRTFVGIFIRITSAAAICRSFQCYRFTLFNAWGWDLRSIWDPADLFVYRKIVVFFYSFSGTVVPCGNNQLIWSFLWWFEINRGWVYKIISVNIITSSGIRFLIEILIRIVSAAARSRTWKWYNTALFNGCMWNWWCIAEIIYSYNYRTGQSRRWAVSGICPTDSHSEGINTGRIGSIITLIPCTVILYYRKLSLWGRIYFKLIIIRRTACSL